MRIFNIIDRHFKLNNNYYFKMKNTIMTSSLMLKYNIVCIIDECIIMISPFVAITYKIYK